MIALPVLLNFGLVREILKIRCQIYVLIKRVIIPSKIQVTINIFAAPFSQKFSLSLNRRKVVIMRTMGKKVNIFTFQLPIYHILEKEISVGANVETTNAMGATLIASTKILESERTISPASFYEQLPNYYPNVLATSTQQMSYSFCS